jgi:hypothetical protein
MLLPIRAGQYLHWGPCYSDENMPRALVRAPVLFHGTPKVSPHHVLCFASQLIPGVAGQNVNDGKTLMDCADIPQFRAGSQKFVT